MQESNQNDDAQPAKPVLHVQPIIMKAKTSTLGIQVVHDSNWFRACNVPRINDEINFEQEKPKKSMRKIMMFDLGVLQSQKN